MLVSPIRLRTLERADASSDNNDQWALLAGLRFFLSMTVILGHCALLINTDKTGIFGAGLLNPGSAVFGFFILSGYSIAASLDRDVSDFYRRRIVRIWPLYIATLHNRPASLYVLVPKGLRGRLAVSPARRR